MKTTLPGSLASGLRSVIAGLALLQRGWWEDGRYRGDSSHTLQCRETAQGIPETLSGAKPACYPARSMVRPFLSRAKRSFCSSELRMLALLFTFCSPLSQEANTVYKLAGGPRIGSQHPAPTEATTAHSLVPTLDLKTRGNWPEACGVLGLHSLKPRVS